MAMTRRQALARGLAGTSILAVGGVGWRAWDNGAFSVGAGPAYEPWHQWRGGEGPLALVRAGILAANAHNTQPWRFHIANDTIAVLPDPERHLGAFDPFRREMHLSLGCALENLTQAAPAHGLEARIELIPGELTLAPPGQQAAPAATVRLALSACRHW
jgi:hypothetical protein